MTMTLFSKLGIVAVGWTENGEGGSTRMFGEETGCAGRGMAGVDYVDRIFMFANISVSYLSSQDELRMPVFIRAEWSRRINISEDIREICKYGNI